MTITRDYLDQHTLKVGALRLYDLETARLVYGNGASETELEAQRIPGTEWYFRPYTTFGDICETVGEWLGTFDYALPQSYFDANPNDRRGVWSYRAPHKTFGAFVSYDEILAELARRIKTLEAQSAE